MRELAPARLAEHGEAHVTAGLRPAVSSRRLCGVAGKRGWANASAYCASKFALADFTQALNAEGKAHGIRACVVFPGGMATGWGAWSTAERRALQSEPSPPTRALPPEDLAALIVWIAAAPRELVLNEVIATPLEEQGWP